MKSRKLSKIIFLESLKNIKIWNEGRSKRIKVEVILKFKGKNELRKNFDEPVNNQNSFINNNYQENQK